MTMQYVGISKDHSGSMWHLTKPAARDYNSQLAAIQDGSNTTGIKTELYVVKNGIGPGHGRVEREISGQNVHEVRPIEESSYIANGGSTPLFDSVGDLIEQFEKLQNLYHRHDHDVSFLIMVITDGFENASKKWRNKLGEEIKKLQATDKWTFAFRVPVGNAKALAALGIPLGNILEWEQTVEGMRVSETANKAATQSYYNLRAQGVTATSNFYANWTAPKTETRQILQSISKEASVYLNPKPQTMSIKEVAEHYTGNYKKGTCFYQLMKKEKVQDYKLICVQEKNTRNIYSGLAVKHELKLPDVGIISLSPGTSGDYEFFIQSTSVNRKIPANSKVLIWGNPRKL